MLKALYHRFLRKRFFNKMLLSYASITILSLIILVSVVSQNIRIMLIDKEIETNKQVLKSVDNYLEQRYAIVQDIIQQLYSDKINGPAVFSFLQNNTEKLTSEYTDKKQRVDNYIISKLYSHSDIYNIAICKRKDHSIYLYSKKYNRTFDDEEFDFNSMFGVLSQDTYGPRIVPSSFLDQLNMDYSNIYTYATNIKSPDNYRNIGILTVSFNAAQISKVYSDIKDIKGSILVLTPEGDVLFDSSNQYTGKRYPYFKILKNSTTAFLDEECAINMVTSPNSSNVIIAGIMPKRQILSEVSIIQQTIYIISLICILVAILMLFTSVRVFSKRVKVIMQGIQSLQKGDLSARIPVKEPYDEISMIAVNFNTMCDRLEDYISKVYLSEIKQKTAELNALQAQINPHFLYNTLESISMRALTAPGDEISEMIQKLATFFRIVVRGNETIIRISEEIQNCRLYLELYEIRYGEKLEINIHVDKDINKCGIIKLLLQPIIENSFKHGFNQNNDRFRISVTAFQDTTNGEIRLTVEDNGRGIEREQLEMIKSRLIFNNLNNHDEIGIFNVDARIKTIYGKQYGIDIESGEGEGTRVTVRIPIKTRKELMQHL